MRPPTRLVPLLLLALLAPLVAASAHPSPGPDPGPDPEPERPRLVARLATRGEGFVRVRAETLRGLGIASPSAVEVRRLGRPVPVSTSGSSEHLVFLAHDVATSYSAYGTYEFWVHAGTAPRAAAPRSTAASDRPGTTPPSSIRRLDADRVHGPLAGGELEVYAAPRLPTWFLGPIAPGQSLATRLGPRHAAAEGEQTLRAFVYGTHPGPVDVQATWGGADLGRATAASAAGGAVLTWRVAAAQVPADEATLLLRDHSPAPPPPPPQDVTRGRGTIWLDALELEGPVQARVSEDTLAFALSPSARLELDVDGLTAEVLLVRVGPSGTPLGSPAFERFLGAGEDAIRIAIEAADVPAGTRLFASTSARDEEPAPVSERVDPLAAAGAATHVVLAVPDLLEPARRLAAHRTRTGTPSAVVNVEWVYDVYGAGEQDPAAIRAFVQDLAERDLTPLQFLVLAGDATLDRTDMTPFVTIPTPLARTLYNGATAADRLYAMPADAATGGPSVGRLPFRERAEMERFVDRLIAYETRPPAHASRRLMRFVTSEARFGALIDGMIERMFRMVVTQEIPPAFDLEVTFASATSPYLWPPADFNRKVIDGFNEGCLFYTYVGHGFAEGFDSLRVGRERFPILHATDVPRVACTGTPPAVFVVACTTAIFDMPGGDGVGEALLKRPDGPIAYWGATRICHPAANSLLGRGIARYMAKGEGTLRLGEILDRARDQALEPTDPDPTLPLIKAAIRMLARGAELERLLLEGSWMYTLLGDPATRIAFPSARLEVTPVAVTPGALAARIAADLPDGTEIHVSLEVTRDRTVPGRVPAAIDDPLSVAAAPRIRRNHEQANDLALHRTVLTLEGGTVRYHAPMPELPAGRQLVVKAWAIAEGDVHQGAAVVVIPEAVEDVRAPDGD